MEQALQGFLGVERAEFQLPEGVLLMIHALCVAVGGREGGSCLACLAFARLQLVPAPFGQAGGLSVLVRGVYVRGE